MVEPNPNPNPKEAIKARFPLLFPISVGKPLDRWPCAGRDDMVRKSGLGAATTIKGIRGTGPKLLPDDCSHISDHIFLGSDLAAKSRETLKSHSITHVLNCAGFLCPEYFPNEFVYKTLWLRDSPSEDIASLFYDVFDYFEEVRGVPSARVFIHCYQGISRSASFVVAYLMWRHNQSYNDALHDVKIARAIANPNMGFICQLLNLQNIISTPKTAPLHMYRIAPHSAYDPLHLTPKAIRRPGWLALDSRGTFLIRVANSVYVWIGQDCPLAMMQAASSAADQLSRYETEKGPIFICREDEEPVDLWNAFASSSSSSSSSSQNESEMSGVNVVETKRVADYDPDFNLFDIASLGGIFPPIPSFDTGVSPHPIKVPTRETGWSRLRRKFSLSASYNIEGIKVGKNPSCTEGLCPRELVSVHHVGKARQDLWPCSSSSPTSVLNPPPTPRNLLPQKESRGYNKIHLSSSSACSPYQKLPDQHRSSNGVATPRGAINACTSMDAQRADSWQGRVNSTGREGKEIITDSHTKQKQEAHSWHWEGLIEKLDIDTGEPPEMKGEDKD